MILSPAAYDILSHLSRRAAISDRLDSPVRSYREEWQTPKYVDALDLLERLALISTYTLDGQPACITLTGKGVRALDRLHLVGVLRVGDYTGYGRVVWQVRQGRVANIRFGELSAQTWAIPSDHYIEVVPPPAGDLS